MESKEVDDFVMLVDENLKRLSINPLIGQIHKNVYKIVISKQTSLFYRIIEKDKKVELVYFWNNKKILNKFMQLSVIILNYNVRYF